MDENTSVEFWLFGYGSLIWKPPPHFGKAKCNACGQEYFLTSPTSQIEGSPVTSKVTYEDFGSEDHRGTPQAPGRVVTLIERSFWRSLNDQYTVPEEHVWGTAYRIEASKVKEVQEYLDIREINGYSIQYADFHPADGETVPFKCMVYIGMPDNPQFMGVQEPQALARHILDSRGPSGENKEYLYMLDTALQDLSPQSGDAHIADLARRVHALEAAPKDRDKGTEKAVEHEMTGVSKGGTAAATEETEKKP